MLKGVRYALKKRQFWAEWWARRNSFSGTGKRREKPVRRAKDQTGVKRGAARQNTTRKTSVFGKRKIRGDEPLQRKKGTGEKRERPPREKGAQGGDRLWKKETCCGRCSKKECTLTIEHPKSDTAGGHRLQIVGQKEKKNSTRKKKTSQKGQNDPARIHKKRVWPSRSHPQRRAPPGTPVSQGGKKSLSPEYRDAKESKEKPIIQGS